MLAQREVMLCWSWKRLWITDIIVLQASYHSEKTKQQHVFAAFLFNVLE
jgi:hypothetical protein